MWLQFFLLMGSGGWQGGQVSGQLSALLDIPTIPMYLAKVLSMNVRTKYEACNIGHMYVRTICMLECSWVFLIKICLFLGV